MNVNEALLHEPTRPERGPTDSPVIASTLTYTFEPVPYPAPKGYKRPAGEWTCEVRCKDGTRAEAYWTGAAWSWRSWRMR